MTSTTADDHVGLIESLTVGRVLGLVAILTITSFIVDWSRMPRYPSTLPSVGYGKGFVNGVRNSFAWFVIRTNWVKEGYAKFGKQDKAFILPSPPSRPAEIVVSQSQTMWMLEQPDKVIGTHEAHDEVLYSRYNFLGDAFADDVFHTRVIHKHLARALPSLLPAIQTESEFAVDRVLGLDTENDKELNLWEMWLDIIPPITNRILLGETVNRNQEMLRSYVKFADLVVQNSMFMQIFPRIIHPIVGRLLTIPNWLHYWRSAKFSLPVIEKRMKEMAAKAAGDPAYEDWEEPEDFITWSIRQAHAENNQFELVPSNMAKRVLPIEFAAIHTTTLTGLNLLLDLFIASPTSDSTVAALRAEAAEVFAASDCQWNKQSLSKLYKLDSAIRESQRVSNFAATMVERKVLAPEGVTNPSEGWHAPQGSYLTVNLHGLHHDGDVYTDPEVYDAFRFSRQREEYEARPADERDPEEGLRLKKLGMVTTGTGHFAFSHGRHACPGRFFVAHELKMVVAHMLLNYDIKPIAKRNDIMWLGGAIIPDLKASLVVRRKRDTIPSS